MQFGQLKRREFISLLGGAAAWPLVAHAQQPGMAVIGFLSIGSLGPFAHTVAAFSRGLRETGYVENYNVHTEFRWAEGHNERLPAFAADLVSRRVSVIATLATVAIDTIYPFREFAQDGGLIGYGNRLQTAFQWAGVYVGRILKGEKPADLPVLRSTQFELVVNLNTAKALGLAIPPTLLAIADEVIE